MIKKSDNSLELILFQATIGEKHEDYSTELVRSPQIFNQAKKQDINVRFIFLVPYRRNFSLTKEQKEKIGPASIEVAELNPCERQ